MVIFYFRIWLIKHKPTFSILYFKKLFNKKIHKCDNRDILKRFDEVFKKKNIISFNYNKHFTGSGSYSKWYVFGRVCFWPRLSTKRKPPMFKEAKNGIRKMLHILYVQSFLNRKIHI